MPLTKFQLKLAVLLSENRTEDSHLAGGAALNLTPESKRYSNDLDYFHHSTERVAEAFQTDQNLLEKRDYSLDIVLSQPGYIRAIVRKGPEATKVEWAQDSSWRFVPVIKSEVAGYQLHPIDLAVNKLLALAGRDEPRDFLDVIEIDQHILSLGALCWAAPGKDPGFTPLSLLSMIRRRGKYRSEDFARLNLVEQPNLQNLKRHWLDALEQATQFINCRPSDEMGCLYYDRSSKAFVGDAHFDTTKVVPHYGRPGGVLPQMKETTS